MRSLAVLELEYTTPSRSGLSSSAEAEHAPNSSASAASIRSGIRSLAHHRHQLRALTFANHLGDQIDVDVLAAFFKGIDEGEITDLIQQARNSAGARVDEF